MKNFIIMACWLVAGASYADHRGHPEAETAESLYLNLSELSFEAQELADQARYRGDYRAAREWSSIARASANLSFDVQSDVYDALNNGRRSLNLIEYEVRRIETQYLRLETRIDQCSYVLSVRRLTRRIDSNFQDLYDQLQGCGGGGGGGRDNFQCRAADNGWEEHWTGHVGYGRTRREAERNAITECERHHGRCRLTRCSTI
jgi:hypothetical protein